MTAACKQIPADAAEKLLEGIRRNVSIYVILVKGEYMQLSIFFPAFC